MAKAASKARRRAGTGKAAKTKRAGAHPYAHEDHLDACDIDFAAERPTPDHELPAATGGVLMPARKSRAPARRK